jgi:hypothetical protein
MSTWTARTTVRSRPEELLEMLVDPDAIRRWAPVDFELDALDGGCLQVGGHARVAGWLAGMRVGFDVEVIHADGERLTLTATGPIALDVDYHLAATDEGSDMRASVWVRPRAGFTSRVLAGATNAMLAGGALQAAVSRIAQEAEAGRCAMALQ